MLETIQEMNRTEGYQNGGLPSHNVHDMVTGENESPNPVPEFLTGRIPSRNHLNQSYEDINFDTTIPAQNKIATVVELDPISKLADVLTNLQNRPTAQQLTIRPVNSNTMTFDGKSEKFELFEDLFHTMIKMQPEMTEQMKINHFLSLSLEEKCSPDIQKHQLNQQTNYLSFSDVNTSSLSLRRPPNINGTVWSLTQTQCGYQTW